MRYRPRVTIRELVLLVVIVALAAALFVQRQREDALRAQVRTLRFQGAWERQASRRLERYRQEGLDPLRSRAESGDEQIGPPPFPSSFTHD